MYQFWYSLLKYCCTHKYCKIWDNEHKRGIKHTKMVIVGVLMWGRRRWSSLILTGVCVMMWKIVIWALTLCRPSWGEGGGRVCVSLCASLCVFWRFSKAPHSPNMFLSVRFTKTEEVEHDLTQPAPCRFVAPKYRPSNAACSCSCLSPWFVSCPTAWFIHVTPFFFSLMFVHIRQKATENMTNSRRIKNRGLTAWIDCTKFIQSIWRAVLTRDSPVYELCLRATWNPSQHDLHNAVNFLKPQSEDVPPTPL